jgi:hypothetical protein
VIQSRDLQFCQQVNMRDDFDIKAQIRLFDNKNIYIKALMLMALLDIKISLTYTSPLFKTLPLSGGIRNIILAAEHRGIKPKSFT